MNKKAIWIVLGVIVIALVAYFVMNRQTASPESLLNNATESGPQSLKDLLTAGQSVKCEYNDQANNSQGTAYVTTKKMRGDFSSVVEGKTIVSHMIFDNETTYVWQEGETSGLMMKNTADDQTTSPDYSSPEAPQSVNLEEKIDYQCSPWIVNNAMFSLPEGIDFKDLSALIPTTTPSAGAGTSGSASGSADLKALQCAACDSSPAESRAQCKAALECN